MLNASRKALEVIDSDFVILPRFSVYDRIVVAKLERQGHVTPATVTVDIQPVYMSRNSVFFPSSFQSALFFVNLRRNKGFLLAESTFFSLNQQKKKRVTRKEPFYFQDV